MSLTYYLGGNPDGYSEPNNANESGKINLVQIEEYISRISCKIYEIVDRGFQITPDLDMIETLRGKGEDHTRDILKDTHNTFSLLKRGLSIASGYLKQGKKASVDLYKEDIRHRDFIEGIRSATDDGKHRELLTLEIRSDEYGSLGSQAISKLQEATGNLGVGIGIQDFQEKPNGDIDIDSTTRIIRGRIKPKFIKISSAVMKRLRNNTVTTCVANLYNGLKNMGVQIIEYVGGNMKFDDVTQTMKNKEIATTLIKNSHIAYEPMLTMEGEVWAEELLVRFDNGLRTDQGLNQLKELGYTQDLMAKMLSAAVEKAKLGQRVSVNLYLKDVGSDTLLKEVKHITHDLPSNYRKNIIFELLEEKYGMINEKFINHVYALQHAGFSIAIDDLNVSESNIGLSIEILDELLSMGIYPDYIKLDGKHSMEILKDSISKVELNKIRILIGQFALMKPTTIVVEWVQDLNHAKKISNLFSLIQGITLVFQGHQINTGNFGTKEN